MVSPIDLIPGPIYRLGHWLKERPKYIKWWFQRANGKVPPCDCWEFNSSLAKYMIQGLDYLINDGYTDWDATIHKQQYEEMKFARKVLKEFIFLHDERLVVIRKPSEIPKNRTDEGGYVYYMSEKEWEQHEKDLQKAFKYIGKWLWGLWD